MKDCESAFWEFSLRFYSRPDIPELCLVLQDHHGVDVNLLFFFLYVGINGRQITLIDVQRIDAFVRDWRTKVIHPLRAIRRELKNAIGPIDPHAAETLRCSVKRDELLAERLQQEALEREFPLDNIGAVAEPLTAAKANIEAYATLAGKLPKTLTLPLLHRLHEAWK